MSQAAVPYLWHPDHDLAQLADGLVKGFGMPIDHDLYQGPVDHIPRLPQPKQEPTMDEAVKILGTAVPRTEWKSEARFRQIRTLAWLQQQTISKQHLVPLSRALDQLAQLNDHPVSSNALFCLGYWGTETNIPTLKKCYESNLEANKRLAVKALKQITGAQPMLIDWWPEMETTLQNEMRDYMLSIDEEQPRMSMIRKYFNYKNPQLLDTAREAAKKWKVNHELLIDICVADAGKRESQLNALRWLKLQESPEERKKKQLLPQIEMLARQMGDPKMQNSAEQQTLRMEASIVMAKWGKETNETFLALLEEPENSPALKSLREKAMDKLVTNKVAQAVPVIAMRYQYTVERNNVIAALNKIGPQVVDAKLREALLMTEGKEKKITLLKVIEQVCVARDVYDSLGTMLKQAAIDQDLAAAIIAARAGVEKRIMKK